MEKKTFTKKENFNFTLLSVFPSILFSILKNNNKILLIEYT